MALLSDSTFTFRFTQLSRHTHLAAVIYSMLSHDDDDDDDDSDFSITNIIPSSNIIPTDDVQP